MRIAHVSACYRGADGVGNTLAEKLEASLAAGDDVKIFVEAGAPPVPERHGFLAHHLDLADLVDERAGGPSAGFFGADVTLFQFLHPYPLLRAALLLDRGAVAFEWPGFTPAEHYRHEEHFRSLQTQLDRILPYLDHADRILVHSRSMAGEVRALRPGVEDRLEVVNPCVNSSLLDPIAERRAGARAPGGPRVLYVGRYAGNKRLDLLLEAFAGFRREHPGAELWLVGDRGAGAYAAYGREVDAQVEDLGLGAAVRQLGRPDDEALADLWARVDLFATGSLHEGFCLPAAEAMTCGVPVVGFAATALPEVVGEGGVLAPEVGDAGALARAMLEAWDRRHALGEAARRQAVAYGRPAFRARYRALLEELAAAGAERPRGVGRRHLMAAIQDTPIHYEDRSDWPVVGRLLSAVRRRMTLHFEKFYVRKLRRLQGLFNQLTVAELEDLRARLERLEAQQGSGEGEPRAGADLGAGLAGARRDGAE